MSDYRRETHISQLVQQLNWDLLHTRRLVQISCMMYKIHYGLVNNTTPPCFIRASHISPRLDHPLKYVNTYIPTINVYKYSFFPRAVSIWNRQYRLIILCIVHLSFFKFVVSRYFVQCIYLFIIDF